MSTQSEALLEAGLISQLEAGGYALVTIDDEPAMLANLKRQLEVLNHQALAGTPFTASEFERVLNHLNTGGVVERAKILRDKYALHRDDGSTAYVTFLNCEPEGWCLNEFQVCNQISMDGKRKNRYDVTLLINGLPLVQIELKRRGVELKLAFNQINRYQHESYDAGAGLFQYVQVFVISNGVNTKYFSNNKKQSFEQTFFWTDEQNAQLTDLSEFAAEFLKPCFIAKVIARYIVITESGILKVLRPYQYFAIEAMLERMKGCMSMDSFTAGSVPAGGYIWHTTGSGKTLTSFKAAQIIQRMPDVQKVLFVVDRKDLDYQTAKEFNEFSKGSVDSTNDTSHLVKQLINPNVKLIVTTLQKLNNAIHSERHSKRIDALRDQRVVFIFDECHRSQFGETHKGICAFFTRAVMFGFTGTPIFAENASAAQGLVKTTADLFGKCLHRYLIVDAIRDENVLRFSVEYVGRFVSKESANAFDEKVPDIDRQELLDSPKRIESIADFILTHHRQKTKHPDFTAMMCVSSVQALITYYDAFARLQAQRKAAAQGMEVDHINIATIFSYAPNEDNAAADGMDGVNGLIPEEAVEAPSPSSMDASSRDALDRFIGDYNATFGTSYNTSESQSFYSYYQDIAKRVRAGQIDILLVVNMFLTGFDSPRLNTMYVDKNLRHHGLIQAYSRTNRILNERKSQGNIVCFRNLKQATDDAIALFSDKDALDTVLLNPYEDYVADFNRAVEELLAIAPTVKSVDLLDDEEDQLAFVMKFRELLRLKNILASFWEFDSKDLALSNQAFEDYKSKYLDIHERASVRAAVDGPEKVSVLNDVDFELTLVHKDEINLGYILKLLTGYGQLAPEEAKKRFDKVMKQMAGQVHLRSKRELIQLFISESLPKLGPVDDVAEKFDEFVSLEQIKAFDALCIEEMVDPVKLKKLIAAHSFSGRAPRQDEVGELLTYKPKILERATVILRLSSRLSLFFERFSSTT
jgi:type I restriction enzyme R subunit